MEEWKKEIEERLKSLEERLKVLEERVDAMDESFGNAIDRLEERVSSIRSNMVRDYNDLYRKIKGG